MASTSVQTFEAVAGKRNNAFAVIRILNIRGSRHWELVHRSTCIDEDMVLRKHESPSVH